MQSRNILGNIPVLSIDSPCISESKRFEGNLSDFLNAMKENMLEKCKLILTETFEGIYKSRTKYIDYVSYFNNFFNLYSKLISNYPNKFSDESSLKIMRYFEICIYKYWIRLNQDSLDHKIKSYLSCFKELATIYNTRFEISQEVYERLTAYIQYIYEIGYKYRENNKYEEAKFYFKYLLKIYQQFNISKKESDCLNELGNIYYGIFKNRKAKIKYNEAIIKYEELRLDTGINREIYAKLAKCYNNLGKCYSIEGNNIQAIQNIEKAIKYYQLELNNIEKSNSKNKNELKFKYNAKLNLCYRNIANAYYRMRNFDSALKLLESALVEFENNNNKYNKKEDKKELSFIYHDFHNIFRKQNDFSKSEKYINLAISVYPNNDLKKASYLKDKAKLLNFQNKYEASKKALQDVLKIYNSNTEWKESANFYKINAYYANTLLQCALASDTKNDIEKYAYTNECREIFNNLILENDKVFETRKLKLTDFDLVYYEKIIDAYARLLIYFDSLESAANLYFEQAKKWHKKFPLHSLSWIRLAIKYIRLISEKDYYKSIMSKLYYLRSEIAYAQKRYFYSLKSMRQALNLSPNNETWETKYQGNIKEVENLLSSIDLDLYAQLERAHEIYYDLERQYLLDLNKNPKLSEYSENRTTELLIKLRNILDMAYARLIRYSIYNPNNENNKITELYFPIAGSKLSLNKKLRQQKIINKYEVKQELFKLSLINPTIFIERLNDNKYIIINKSEKYGYTVNDKIKQKSNNDFNVENIISSLNQNFTESLPLLRRCILKDCGDKFQPKIPLKSVSDPQLIKFLKLKGYIYRDENFLHQDFYKKFIIENNITPSLNFTIYKKLINNIFNGINQNNQFDIKKAVVDYNKDNLPDDKVCHMQIMAYLNFLLNDLIEIDTTVPLNGEELFDKLIENDGELFEFTSIIYTEDKFIEECLNEVNAILNTVRNKNNIKESIKAFCNILQSNLKIDNTKFDPIIILLIENKYLSIPQAILTNKFINNFNNLRIESKVKLDDMELFESYQKTVTQQLVDFMSYSGNKNSLDDINHQKAFDAIYNNQSFTFFNQGKTGEWLEILTAIQNESKHVRLSTQGLNGEIEEQTVNIFHKNVLINIEYVNTRYSSWSFLKPLKTIENNKPDKHLFETSSAILKFLKEKKYIDKRVVIHKKADEVVKKLQFEENNTNEIKFAEKEFIDQLKSDLPTKWHNYAEAIGIHLLTKAKQRRRLEVSFSLRDSLDVTYLINNSLDKVTNILKDFGDVRNQIENNESYNKSLLKLDELGSISYKNQSYHDIDQDFETVLDKKFSEKDDLNTLSYIHNYLKQCKNINKSNKKWLLLGKAYFKAAEWCSTQHKWLALIYYSKALDYISLEKNGLEMMFSTSKRAAILSRQLKLWKTSKSYIYRGYNCLILNLKDKLDLKEISKTIEAQKDLERGKIKDKIFSQLMHYHECNFEVKHLVFKLYQEPSNIYLIHKIQNRIVEMIIKIRHLLDQAFGELTLFIHKINKRLMETWDVKFPCSASKERLKEFIIEALAKYDANHFNKTTHPLFEQSDFIGVYKKICSSQPFLNNLSNSLWLEQLIYLSNRAKHVSLEYPNYEDLMKSKGICNSIEDFYIIKYKYKKWTFIDCLDIPFNRSEEIIKYLSQNEDKLFDKNGEINQGSKFIKKISSYDNKSILKVDLNNLTIELNNIFDQAIGSAKINKLNSEESNEIITTLYLYNSAKNCNNEQQDLKILPLLDEAYSKVYDLIKTIFNNMKLANNNLLESNSDGYQVEDSSDNDYVNNRKEKHIEIKEQISLSTKVEPKSSFLRYDSANNYEYTSDPEKNAQRDRLHDEEKVNQKLINRIPSDFQLGAAIGKGDCFFDAMAQSLNALNGSKEYTAKSLRLLCDDYIKNGKYTWVKEAIELDSGNFDQYLVRIQFTAEELEIEENTNTGFKLEDIVWGRPEIEGRIICEIANIKLHVIGVLEQPINGIDITEQLVDAQASEPIMTIEKGQYDTSNVVHLVNYDNHFVPLLDNKIFQTEKHYLSDSELFNNIYESSESDESGIVVTSNNNLKQEKPDGILKYNNKFTIFSSQNENKENQNNPEITKVIVKAKDINKLNNN